MNLAQEIEDALRKTFTSKEDIIELLDEKHDQRHWLLRVTTSQFEGKSRLERSRTIYALLADYMIDDHIHALSLELKTPSELTK